MYLDRKSTPQLTFTRTEYGKFPTCNLVPDDHFYLKAILTMSSVVGSRYGTLKSKLRADTLIAAMEETSYTSDVKKSLDLRRKTVTAKIG